MAKSARLRRTDLRTIVQLAHECRDLGDDPRGWRRHMAAGLARLTGAGVVNLAESVDAFGPRPRGLGITSWGWENGFNHRAWERLIGAFMHRGPDFSPAHRPYGRALARAPGACRSRPELVPDRAWYRSEYYEFHRQVGTDMILYCYLPLAAAGELSEAVVVRAAKEPDFTGREKALVREAHRAIAPLIGGPLARFAEPSPAALPPRLRQVLRCLLEGDADKQVAARLRISRHTVNHYTKQIFQHFGVAGRSELLARWIRRGWGSRSAWTDAPPSPTDRSDRALTDG